ncbi:MAG: 16S rRNA (cytosine(967)-C(5))-methyltransferase RsmB [Solirubrobacteraceae bacterium]
MISPARACAFDVVRRVFEQGAYADRAFTSRAAALDARERAFAMQLTYGTVQRRATLDHVAQRLCTRPLAELDPPVLAALRLGLFQLLLLGGVAEHAAVNESVELVKGAGGAGLVNAVLRRSAHEGSAILGALDDAAPAGAAIKHSVPQWLAERWWSERGGPEALALLRTVNDPAESALRVNTLRESPAAVLARLPVPARPAPGLPEGIVLGGAFDAHGSPLWRAGAIMPQSRASMLVSRVLDPRPGERVLDLCAAPGGKTTHLAALMGDAGEIVAVELHRGRADALRQTCSRMGTACIEVQLGNASAFRARAPFDRVLVDPPCSGLGTLGSRPDLRWRAGPAEIDAMAARQAAILAAGARATRAGGVLVYSVCTISRAESEDVVEGFLRSHREFTAQDLGSDHPPWGAAGAGRPGGVGPYLQLLPHRDRTDGFFVAALRRA